MIYFQSVISCLLILVCINNVVGGPDSIDGLILEPRLFNEFPNSALDIRNDYPRHITISESQFGQSTRQAIGATNRHIAWFASTVPSVRHAFHSGEAFDLSVDVRIDRTGADDGRVYEAGIIFNSIGGDSQFIVKSDGEIAVFGSFDLSHLAKPRQPDGYELGSVARLRLSYRPRVNNATDSRATVECSYNGRSTGPLPVQNIEKELIEGSIAGVYVQFIKREDASETDALWSVHFENIRVSSPGLNLNLPQSFVTDRVDRTIISTAHGNGNAVHISNLVTHHNLAPEYLPVMRNVKNDSGSKVYLRFDISQLRGRRIADAALLLNGITYRGSDQVLNLFGLREDVDNSAEYQDFWSPVLVSGEHERETAPSWTGAPGNDPERGGGYWEQRKLNSAGVISDAVEYLGTIPLARGRQSTYIVPQSSVLTSFLNKDSNGIVTLIVTKADPSNTPNILINSNDPLLGSPELILDTYPVSSRQNIRHLCNTLLNVGGNEASLEVQWASTVEVAGGGSAEDAQARGEALLQACRAASAAGVQVEADSDEITRSSVESRITLVTAVVELLKCELSYSDNQISSSQRAVLYESVLSRHPLSSGCILETVIHLVHDTSGQTLEGFSEQGVLELIKRNLPSQAQYVLARLYDSFKSPPRYEKRNRIDYYRRQAYSSTDMAQPYYLEKYIIELDRYGRNGEADLILDTLSYVKRGDPVGVAAAQIKTDRDASEVVEIDHFARMIEVFGERQINIEAAVGVLKAMSQHGTLPQILRQLYNSTGETVTAEMWVDMIYEAVPRIRSGYEDHPYITYTHLDQPMLGDTVTPFELAVSLAEEDYTQANYKRAEIAAFRAIALEEINLVDHVSGATIRDLSDLDDVGDAKAIASLLIGICEVHLGREELGASYFEEALDSLPGGRSKVLVLMQQAKLYIDRGDAGSALQKLREALQHSPQSEYIQSLAGLLSWADPNNTTNSAIAHESEKLITQARQITDPDISQQSYIKAAELLQELGHIEQAIGTYQEMALRYPESPVSQAAFERVVAILESQQDTLSLMRADTIRDVIDGQNIRIPEE